MAWSFNTTSGHCLDARLLQDGQLVGGGEVEKLHSWPTVASLPLHASPSSMSLARRPHTLHVLACPTFAQLLYPHGPIAPALKYKFPPWTSLLNTLALPFHLFSKSYTAYHGLSRYPFAPEALRRCRQWRLRGWPASPRQDCLPLRK